MRQASNRSTFLYQNFDTGLGLDPSDKSMQVPAMLLVQRTVYVLPRAAGTFPLL